jgi:hypothetical protein
LQVSLGWVPGPQYEAFFRWKHEESPFGPSPSWVAVDGTRIAGFRTFVRWEFDRPAGGPVRAVRAVDTATHPDYQGRGIFTSLTTRGLADCGAEGIGFVFNTPNDQSRPGYLKMGWQVVGRLPVVARFRSPGSLVRAARARVPAEKWSEPCAAGQPAPDVFADRDAVDRLLATVTDRPGVRTRRTGAFLAWRYGFTALAYRAAVVNDSIDDGVVVFRTRRRGRALELAITDVLVAPGLEREVKRVVRTALQASGADYAIRIGGPAAVASGPAAGFVTLPQQGPVFTWRHVNEPASAMPPLDSWALSLGDVELF